MPRHPSAMDEPRVSVTLFVNGRRRDVDVPACATLLDVLRDTLGLTGAKRGCDLGACGACTVLSDGRRVNACLALAASQEGRDIVTIEGLARDGALHPLQATFVAHDALQCGFCTPGQIMSAVGLLAESPSPEAGELPARMSGNLCRCGSYDAIIAAIAETAGLRT